MVDFCTSFYSMYSYCFSYRVLFPTFSYIIINQKQMPKKKNKKHFFHGFDRVWFQNETEYFIFLGWAVFVIIFLISIKV
jgi:hypothetical protein